MAGNLTKGTDKMAGNLTRVQVEKGGKFETALEHNRSITYWLVACVFGVTLNWGKRVKFQI